MAKEPEKSSCYSDTKKGSSKERLNYWAIAQSSKKKFKRLPSTLKSLEWQSPDLQAGFNRGKESKFTLLPVVADGLTQEKTQEEPWKSICFIDYTKDCFDHNKLWIAFKNLEILAHLINNN